jgi:hypothetical protein
MARFAPVAPPQVLRGLKDMSDHIVGRYHLLLAHDVAARPEEYRGLLPDNSLVIMDNSIIELGEPVDAETMKAALDVVPAQVIVLPDMIRDASRTLELSIQGAADYARIIDPRVQTFMAVPQGKDLAELKECAWQLRQIPQVSHWGVGRFVTEMLGTRTDFTSWLWENPAKVITNRFSPFIHLLGFSDNLEDDLTCARYPGVLGIDSAAPVRMGQYGQMVSRNIPSHTPRGDWWLTADGVIQPATVANLSLIRAWIAENYSEAYRRRAVQTGTPSSAVPQLPETL